MLTDCCILSYLSVADLSGVPHTNYKRLWLPTALLHFFLRDAEGHLEQSLTTLLCINCVVLDPLIPQPLKH